MLRLINAFRLIIWLDSELNGFKFYTRLLIFPFDSARTIIANKHSWIVFDERLIWIQNAIRARIWCFADHNDNGNVVFGTSLSLLSNGLDGEKCINCKWYLFNVKLDENDTKRRTERKPHNSWPNVVANEIHCIRSRIDRVKITLVSNCRTITHNRTHSQWQTKIYACQLNKMAIMEFI